MVENEGIRYPEDLPGNLKQIYAQYIDHLKEPKQAWGGDMVTELYVWLEKNGLKKPATEVKTSSSRPGAFLSTRPGKILGWTATIMTSTGLLWGVLGRNSSQQPLPPGISEPVIEVLGPNYNKGETPGKNSGYSRAWNLISGGVTEEEVSINHWSEASHPVVVRDNGIPVFIVQTLAQKADSEINSETLTSSTLFIKPLQPGGIITVDADSKQISIAIPGGKSRSFDLPEDTVSIVNPDGNKIIIKGEPPPFRLVIRGGEAEIDMREMNPVNQESGSPLSILLQKNTKVMISATRQQINNTGPHRYLERNHYEAGIISTGSISSELTITQAVNFHHPEKSGTIGFIINGEKSPYLTCPETEIGRARKDFDNPLRKFLEELDNPGQTKAGHVGRLLEEKRSKKLGYEK